MWAMGVENSHAQQCDPAGLAHHMHVCEKGLAHGKRWSPWYRVEPPSERVVGTLAHHKQQELLPACAGDARHVL